LNRERLAVAAALVAAGAIAGWGGASLLRPGQPSPASPADAERAVETLGEAGERGSGASAGGEIGALRAEVEALRLEVAHLTRFRSGAPVETASQRGSGPQRREKKTRVGTEVRPGESPTERRHRAIADAHQSEALDEAWSEATESHLHEVFTAEEIAGATLAEADCRETMCRLEVIHSTDADIRDFGDEFVAATAAVLPRATWRHIKEPDGRTRTVVYMAREGFGLPGPDR